MDHDGMYDIRIELTKATLATNLLQKEVDGDPRARELVDVLERSLRQLRKLLESQPGGRTAHRS